MEINSYQTYQSFKLKYQLRYPAVLVFRTLISNSQVYFLQARKTNGERLQKLITFQHCVETT